MGCSLARRVASTVASEAALLGQAWTRDLFTAFCGWDGLRRERGDMPRHVRRYAAFFAVVDRNCASAAEVTQARLVELHGAEGLRRGFQVVAFLVDRLALGWDASAVVTATERERVAATIIAAADEPWANDLERYRTHLTAGSKLAPGTMRMYVAAAAALLRASDVQTATELTRRHVARHTRRSPGRRTNLLRFLSWITGQSGRGFGDNRSKRTSARKRERATLRRAGGLLERLAAARDPREGRAVLAAAIAVLHHVPLKCVLALRGCDVREDNGAVMIGQGGVDIELAAPLSAAFKRFTGPGPLAFPGRNGVQPLTTGAVRHHLRLDVLTARVLGSG